MPHFRSSYRRPKPLRTPTVLVVLLKHYVAGTFLTDSTVPLSTRAQAGATPWLILTRTGSRPVTAQTSLGAAVWCCSPLACSIAASTSACCGPSKWSHSNTESSATRSNCPRATTGSVHTRSHEPSTTHRCHRLSGTLPTRPRIRCIYPCCPTPRHFSAPASPPTAARSTPPVRTSPNSTPTKSPATTPAVITY